MKKLALVLVVLGFLSRLIPHAANFTALGGITLFSGFYLGGGYRWAVPFLLMGASDVILNFWVYHTGFSAIHLAVYFAIALNILLAGKLSAVGLGRRLMWGIPLSSLNFFAVTNLGVWLTSQMYPRSFAGLMECFVAAIPFLGNELLGNAIFATAFVGAYELVHGVERKRLSVAAW